MVMLEMRVIWRGFASSLCRKSCRNWKSNVFYLRNVRGFSSGQNLRSSSYPNLSLRDKKVEEFIRKQSTDPSAEPTLKLIISQIQEKQMELKELEILAEENCELKDMAKADAKNLEIILEKLEDRFFTSLIQEDEADENDIILEVSAGVGGQEAMLFTQEIFQMYQSFASYCAWDFELLSFDSTEIGGVRHASASISGHNVYQRMKYEGGVHRVQRIPQTEKSGRIHTSTCAVAVLPQPTEIQVVIKPSDLKIETKKAGGAGGQHVNTTESAVRITHIPSGISVDSQTERSQIQNRTIGMKAIRAKLYEKQLEEETRKHNLARKLQVGLSSRSEKIRTYNFPSNRVTDHRIGYTVHNTEGILEGRDILKELFIKLSEYDRMERLMQLFIPQSSK